MNDIVGNIQKNKFYACCYILLSGARPMPMHIYLRRCFAILGATGAETSLLLTAYCIE